MDETPEYEEVQRILNQLITGRRRPTKGVWEWEHPLEAFNVYLEVHGLHMHDYVCVWHPNP